MAQKLIEQFNVLFPGHAATKVVGDCTITEKTNINRENTFKQLTISGFNGWRLPESLAEDLKSFHDKTQAALTNKTAAQNILGHVCDGILCTGVGNILRVYIIEMKTKFSSAEIVKAKDQVVGSFIKLRWLFGLLNRFQGVDIRVKGIIASHEPTLEGLDAIRNLTDQGARFCLALHKYGHYYMPADRCSAFWTPLLCQNINIQYIPIPFKSAKYQLDFTAIE